MVAKEQKDDGTMVYQCPVAAVTPQISQLGTANLFSSSSVVRNSEMGLTGLESRCCWDRIPLWSL